MDNIKDIALSSPAKWGTIAGKIDENLREAAGARTVTYSTDVATTRKQIKLEERKYGLILSYVHPELGDIQERYIGKTTDNTNWSKNENWIKIDKIFGECNDFITSLKPYDSNLYKFLANNGISDFVSTKPVHKFKVKEFERVYITLISNISLGLNWSAFWTVDDNGEMIKSYDVDFLGNKFVNYELKLTENVSEIWINPGSIYECGVIKMFSEINIKVENDDTENILNFTDDNGNIYLSLDKDGKIITKESLGKIDDGSQAQLSNHWKNKIWYAYGTSITSIAQGNYVDKLENLSGMVATNKGIPGGGITNLGGFSKGQVKDAIMNVSDGKINADLITLEVGANEGGLIGDKYDKDDNSFCGCLNQCIRYLQENTNAQIVVMPSVSTKTEPSEAQEYYNRLAAIKSVCEINRVYYIDGCCGLGWAKIHNDAKYTVDNIHQSVLGGYILAKHIWSILRNIPTWTTNI